MLQVNQTVVSKVSGKVTPTISEKGVGLTAGKTYDAVIETIERVIERTEINYRVASTKREVITDVVITVTTDKGDVSRFGSEFFYQVG